MPSLRWAILSTLAAAAARAGEPGEEPPLLDAARAADVRDDTPEAEREWPSAAVAYVVREVAERPEVAACSRGLERLTGTTPSPARFAIVWFRGRLEEMTDGPDRLHVGRVLLGEGEGAREAVFVTDALPRETQPDEKPTPPGKPITDGLVQVRGIFVKRYRTGDRAPAFLVVAADIQRAYETRPVRSLDDVGFDAVRDDQKLVEGGDGGLEASRDYPLPLMRLVKYADAGAPAGQKPETLDDAHPFLKEPAKLRGRFVTGTGFLADEPLLLSPGQCTPNDAGVESCVTGWIVSDQQQLFQFVAPERLAGIGKKSQRVRFTGFFYKGKTYLARDGSTRIAPMFVLTDLTPLG